MTTDTTESLLAKHRPIKLKPADAAEVLRLLLTLSDKLDTSRVISALCGPMGRA